MSETPNSRRDPRREKRIAVQRLENFLGPTTQATSRRPDWRISRDGRTSVFLTFSQEKDLWYDVGLKDIRSWKGYTRAFVAFVMGGAENVLLIPVSALERHLVDRLSVDQRGNFNLHIRRGEKWTFAEIPGWDLTPFRNWYAQLEGSAS